jgi:hypothetical protein
MDLGTCRNYPDRRKWQGAFYMKVPLTLRVHNAMVTDRMRSDLNQLRTSRGLGHKTDLGVHEDRNALALHYIESGAINRFSVRHRIKVRRG